jgi:hypothetical protein
MMESTDKLIASLAETASPVRQSEPPTVLFARWFIGALVYVALVLAFMKLRPDIFTKIGSPVFAAELVTLVFVIASSAFSAALLSFPDMFQKRDLAFTPLIAIIGFGIVLALEYAGEPQPDLGQPHGEECLLCITLLSLLPAAFMFYTLRRQAGVHYYISGAVSLIFASGVGALALRLSENTDSMNHILQWHYLPMIGFGVIGILLGRIVLKW